MSPSHNRMLGRDGRDLLLVQKLRKSNLVGHYFTGSELHSFIMKKQGKFSCELRLGK